MTPLLRSFVFERVWQTVQDNYVYDDFGGVDWQGDKSEYRKLILQMPDNGSFYWGIDDMIYDLNDDHSVYLSPWDSCIEDGWEAEPLESDTDAEYEEATSVSFSRMKDDILLITLNSFDSETIDERFTTELRAALREGRVKSIILDLRNNYGGYLDMKSHTAHLNSQQVSYSSSVVLR